LFSSICFAQDVPPAAPPAAPPAPATPQVQATPAPTPPPASNVPDYPDPRTFEIGVFYWLTGPGQQPNLVTGRGATDFETLDNLGKVHRTPGIEASMPITRTGTLHIEASETKGTGSQTAAVANDLFTATISAGDFLNTQFQIRNVKLYYDDLLYPHKFPVSRLRFKSIWAIDYLGMHTNINNPYNVNGETADGTNNIILPMFGLAAEYAPARHVLFRLEGSGFGIYHRSDIWDASATLTWRVTRHVEVVAGYKAMHFKSSPQSTEYVIGNLNGAFFGARWHL
jgi:hypothetical protein